MIKRKTTSKILNSTQITYILMLKNIATAEKEAESAEQSGEWKTDCRKHDQEIYRFGQTCKAQSLKSENQDGYPKKGGKTVTDSDKDQEVYY